MALTALALTTAPGYAAPSVTGAPLPSLDALSFTWPGGGEHRPSDVAPDMALGDKAGTTWRSSAWLGRQPIFLLVENGSSRFAGDAPLNQAIEDARTRIEAQVVTVDATAKLPQGQHLSGFDLLTPQFALAGAFGAPSFVAIDRAGFIRDIEPLPDVTVDPTQTRLRFLLKTTPDPTPPLEVGKPAPDFSFPDANGHWHRIADLRGRKNLLLTFFPKCFTGGCAAPPFPLRDHFAGFIASNTEIWAVSVDAADSPGGQRAFAAHLGLPFPLLPDTGRNLSLLYGAVATTKDRDHRQSVLIDKDGIVRWIDRDVAPLTHGVDVLAQIHALGLDQ